MKNHLAWCVLLGVFCLLSACAPPARHKVHHAMLGAVAPPKKILVLPAEIKISEISAGGLTEEVPEWTRAAKSNIDHALADYIGQRADLSAQPLPELTREQQAQLQEHAALYLAAAGMAYNLTQNGGPAWQHKRDRFDYTLGVGLRFLKEASNADAALFIVGEDYVSSSDRKAVAFFATALGAAVQLGHSLLTAGMVDLHTGDILWLDYSFSYANRDLRQPDDARSMIRDMLDNYPGLDAYKDR